MNKRVCRALAFCLLGGFLAAAASVYAQERAVGGSLQTEASWSALSSMINATNGNVKTLRVEVNEIKKCGSQKKIWTGTQCVDSAAIDSIIACGKQGAVFNGTGCTKVSGGNRWILAGSFSQSSLVPPRKQLEQKLAGANASRQCGGTEVAGRQCSTENSRCNNGISCDVERPDGKANRWTCSVSYISCN